MAARLNVCGRSSRSIARSRPANQTTISVIADTLRGENWIHVRLVSRGRWEFPELKRQAVALAEIWRPNAVLIEDAASGQSLIQALKAETRLPILPVKPLGDKVARAPAVSPLVESGRVCLPESAAWLADFLDEVSSFPAAPHDDQVDAFTQALGYMRGSYFDSATFQQVAQRQIVLSDQRRRRIADFSPRPMKTTSPTCSRAKTEP